MMYHVITDNGEIIGRVSGHKPKQAANTAGSMVLKFKGSSDKTTFSIKETCLCEEDCSCDSDKQQFDYSVERIDLGDAHKMMVSDQEIKYRYNIKVQSIRNS